MWERGKDPTCGRFTLENINKGSVHDFVLNPK